MFSSRLNSLPLSATLAGMLVVPGIATSQTIKPDPAPRSPTVAPIHDPTPSAHSAQSSALSLQRLILASHTSAPGQNPRDLRPLHHAGRIELSAQTIALDASSTAQTRGANAHEKDMDDDIVEILSETSQPSLPNRSPLPMARRVSGRFAAWTQLVELTQRDIASAPTFLEIGGLDSEGSRHPALNAWLDWDRFIDVIICQTLHAELESPPELKSGLRHRNPHNQWFAIKSRSRRTGFVFVPANPSNPTPATHAPASDPVPADGPFLGLWAPLWTWAIQSPEFRIHVLDLVEHRLKRHRDWMGVASSDLGAAQPQFEATLAKAFERAYERFRRTGLVSTLPLPQRQEAEPLGPLRRITLHAEGDVVYYTTDGTDPRGVGGDLGLGAREAREPIEVPRNDPIRARAFRNQRWGAMEEWLPKSE